MNFKSVFFLLIVYLSIDHVVAQQDQSELFSIISEIAEQSISENPNNSDFNTAFETLSDYAEVPLNLNQATEEDLHTLLFVSEIEVKLIIEYRKRLKRFVELDELLFVGISESTLNLLRIFTTVKPVSQMSDFSLNSLNEGKQELFFRWFRNIEKEKGFIGETPNYLGDPNKLYIRYKYSLGQRIQAGLCLEKDAGEIINWSQAQFKSPLDFADYNNVFLSFKGNRKLKKTILGAYSLTLGQGLLSWNGFSLGKSSLLDQSKKTKSEINPYSSANETNYLKGIALHVSPSETVTLIPYFSWKKIDSKFSNDSLQELATSIPITGLHRTESEIEGKHKNRELISGISVKKEFKKLYIRSNYQALYYRFPIQKGDLYYQARHFEGQSLHALSLDYKYIRKRFIVFGESAFQSKRETAHLVGIKLFPSASLTNTILYRNYSQGYCTAYNAGFGEKSNTQNETGLYVNSKYQLSSKWSLHFFLDYYERKAPSFESKSPYSGQELFFQINHTVHQGFSHYLRFNYEENTALSSGSSLTNQFKKLRYHLNLEPHWSLKLRSRIELNSFNDSNYGYLFYQDLKYKIPRTSIHLSTRYASFGIPQFEQAIYAYENDVLFFFNTPSYRDKGSKVYLLLDFPLGNRFHFWCRVSQWFFENQTTISSGNSEIESNRKTSVHFQTRLLF